MTIAGAVPSVLASIACGGGSAAHQHSDAGSRDANPASDALKDGSSTDAPVSCNSGQQGVSCVAAADPTHVMLAITVDEQNVYWMAQGPGFGTNVVAKAPRAGGATVTLATVSTSSHQSLASDGAHVYWSDISASGDGSIKQVAVAGGSAATLAPANRPVCVALDEFSVYWTEESGSVVKVPKAGGTPTTLATSGPAYALAVGPDSVYWISDALMAVSTGGGDPVTVWDPSPAGLDIGGCRTLALSGATLVLETATEVVPEQFDVEAVPVAGATSPALLGSSNDPLAVVASAADAFWVGVATDIEVNETPIQGGPTTTLATPDARSVVDIVRASDGTLYWATDVQIQSLTP
jgi:hypothetical protein